MEKFFIIFIVTVANIILDTKVTYLYTLPCGLMSDVNFSEIKDERAVDCPAPSVGLSGHCTSGVI